MEQPWKEIDDETYNSLIPRQFGIWLLIALVAGPVVGVISAIIFSVSLDEKLATESMTIWHGH